MEKFSTRFTASFTLNIAQMIELQRALQARVVKLYGLNDPEFDGEIQWDKVAWCREVLEMLDPVVDRGVLEYEAEIAREEAQILDDPAAVKKFLES
jgi:uncharacterized protein involved in exopolysaccharide biosynthesis